MGQRIRVLVTDDHEDGADALGTLLGDSGCDVRVVHDGRRAVDVAQSFEPQVVILDLLMPGLDGFATAAVLKQQPWSRTAVYVAHTGYSPPGFVEKAMRAGFHHFLRKPAPFEQFERILSMVAGPAD